ncbi:MAG: hypothetical protein PHW10_01630 [Candidatus Peribacteraceae bacterium]|nr:hypothetical protein [Candidatus Peribacteraceae bacterium]
MEAFASSPDALQPVPGQEADMIPLDPASNDHFLRDVETGMLPAAFLMQTAGGVPLLISGKGGQMRRWIFLQTRSALRMSPPSRERNRLFRLV